MWAIAAMTALMAVSDESMPYIYIYLSSHRINDIKREFYSIDVINIWLRDTFGFGSALILDFGVNSVKIFLLDFRRKVSNSLSIVWNIE